MPTTMPGNTPARESLPIVAARQSVPRASLPRVPQKFVGLIRDQTACREHLDSRLGAGRWQRSSAVNFEEALHQLPVEKRARRLRLLWPLIVCIS